MQDPFSDFQMAYGQVPRAVSQLTLRAPNQHVNWKWTVSLQSPMNATAEAAVYLNAKVKLESKENTEGYADEVVSIQC